jgi:hypothetical protein
MNLRVALLLTALPGILSAQAAVEAALGAGRAATSTAGTSKKVGQGIGGAFEKLSKTVEDSTSGKSVSQPKTTAPSRTSTSATARRTSTPVLPEIKPDASYEHPSGIETGILYKDLLQRFGPPALQFTSGDQLTLCYVSRDGVTIDVAVRNGKVAEVKKPPVSETTDLKK